MEFNNVRIKETIAPEDIAGAIDLIANSCFVNGKYNPYYQSFAERVAVVSFFLEGITFEDDDSLYMISELDEVKGLVNKFLADPKYNKQNEPLIMATVRNNVEKVIEFKKQRLIHGADAIEYIASAIGDFRNFINDLDSALTNISKIDFSAITKQDIDETREIIAKLNKSGIELNEDTIVKFIKEAANFNFDKATQEIIDSKNAEIIELKKSLEQITKPTENDG